MVEEKGLAPEVANKIKGYVTLAGGKELIEKLQRDQSLVAVKDATIGLEEMKLLFHYCDLFGVLNNVSFAWL